MLLRDTGEIKNGKKSKLTHANQVNMPVNWIHESFRKIAETWVENWPELKS